MCINRRGGVVVERSPCFAEERGSITGGDRPKSLEQVLGNTCLTYKVEVVNCIIH